MFRHHFEPSRHEFLRTQDIMNIKKKQNESISAYALRLRGEADRIDLSEEMLEYSFIQGLSSDFKKHLIKKEIKG